MPFGTRLPETGSIGVQQLLSRQIHTKKPWHRAIFSPADQAFIVHDSRRVGYLPVREGPFKRAIPGLEPLRDSAISVAVSERGDSVVVTTCAGELFLWRRLQGVAIQVSWPDESMGLVSKEFVGCTSLAHRDSIAMLSKFPTDPVQVWIGNLSKDSNSASNQIEWQAYRHELPRGWCRLARSCISATSGKGHRWLFATLDMQNEEYLQKQMSGELLPHSSLHPTTSPDLDPVLFRFKCVSSDSNEDTVGQFDTFVHLSLSDRAICMGDAKVLHAVSTRGEGMGSVLGAFCICLAKPIVVIFGAVGCGGCAARVPQLQCTSGEWCCDMCLCWEGSMVAVATTAGRIVILDALCNCLLSFDHPDLHHSSFVGLSPFHGALSTVVATKDRQVCVFAIDDISEAIAMNCAGETVKGCSIALLQCLAMSYRLDVSMLEFVARQLGDAWIRDESKDSLEIVFAHMSWAADCLVLAGEDLHSRSAIRSFLLALYTLMERMGKSNTDTAALHVSCLMVSLRKQLTRQPEYGVIMLTGLKEVWNAISVGAERHQLDVSSTLLCLAEREANVLQDVLGLSAGGHRMAVALPCNSASSFQVFLQSGNISACLSLVFASIGIAEVVYQCLKRCTSSGTILDSDIESDHVFLSLLTSGASIIKRSGDRIAASTASQESGDWVSLASSAIDAAPQLSLQATCRLLIGLLQFISHQAAPGNSSSSKAVVSVGLLSPTRCQEAMTCPITLDVSSYWSASERIKLVSPGRQALPFSTNDWSTLAQRIGISLPTKEDSAMNGPFADLLALIWSITIPLKLHEETISGLLASNNLSCATSTLDALISRWDRACIVSSSPKSASNTPILSGFDYRQSLAEYLTGTPASAHIQELERSHLALTSPVAFKLASLGCGCETWNLTFPFGLNDAYKEQILEGCTLALCAAMDVSISAIENSHSLPDFVLAQGAGCFGMLGSWQRQDSHSPSTPRNYQDCPNVSSPFMLLYVLGRVRQLCIHAWKGQRFAVVQQGCRLACCLPSTFSKFREQVVKLALVEANSPTGIMLLEGESGVSFTTNLACVLIASSSIFKDDGSSDLLSICGQAFKHLKQKNSQAADILLAARRPSNELIEAVKAAFNNLEPNGDSLGINERMLLDTIEEYLSCFQQGISHLNEIPFESTLDEVVEYAPTSEGHKAVEDFIYSACRKESATGEFFSAAIRRIRANTVLPKNHPVLPENSDGLNSKHANLSPTHRSSAALQQADTYTSENTSMRLDILNLAAGEKAGQLETSSSSDSSYTGSSQSGSAAPRARDLSVDVEACKTAAADGNSSADSTPGVVYPGQQLPEDRYKHKGRMPIDAQSLAKGVEKLDQATLSNSSYEPELQRTESQEESLSRDARVIGLMKSLEAQLADASKKLEKSRQRRLDKPLQKSIEGLRGAWATNLELQDPESYTATDSDILLKAQRRVLLRKTKSLSMEGFQNGTSSSPSNVNNSNLHGNPLISSDENSDDDANQQDSAGFSPVCSVQTANQIGGTRTSGRANMFSADSAARGVTKEASKSGNCDVPIATVSLERSSKAPTRGAKRYANMLGDLRNPDGRQGVSGAPIPRLLKLNSSPDVLLGNRTQPSDAIVTRTPVSKPVFQSRLASTKDLAKIGVRMKSLQQSAHGPNSAPERLLLLRNNPSYRAPPAKALPARTIQKSQLGRLEVQGPSTSVKSPKQAAPESADKSDSGVQTIQLQSQMANAYIQTSVTELVSAAAGPDSIDDLDNSGAHSNNDMVKVVETGVSPIVALEAKSGRGHSEDNHSTLESPIRSDKSVNGDTIPIADWSQDGQKSGLSSMSPVSGRNDGNDGNNSDNLGELGMTPASDIVAGVVSAATATDAVDNQSFSTQVGVGMLASGHALNSGGKYHSVSALRTSAFNWDEDTEVNIELSDHDTRVLANKSASSKPLRTGLETARKEYDMRHLTQDLDVLTKRVKKLNTEANHLESKLSKSGSSSSSALEDCPPLGTKFFRSNNSTTRNAAKKPASRRYQLSQ